MYKAKITNAEKVRHQARNTDFLDVSFDILDAEGEVQVSRRIGMDVASSKEDVVNEVNKHVVEHGKSVENAELDAKRQEANKNIKDIQDNLVGETIEPGTDTVETGEGEGEGESSTEENNN